jgi:hypothetical protein
MKDKELEKEQIRVNKTKESSLSKLLSQEWSHVNMLARTERWYDKAEKVNLDCHTRKTSNNQDPEDRHCCCQGCPSSRECSAGTERKPLLKSKESWPQTGELSLFTTYCLICY